MRAASDRDSALAKVGSPLLRELYEKARTVINDPAWVDQKRCPLCESMLTKTLAEHLQDRIAQYAAVDAANDALERAILSSANISRLDRLETASVLGITFADRRHVAIVQAARDHTLPTTDIHEALARLDALDVERERALAKARAELTELENTLPPSLVAVGRTLANVRQFCEAIAAYEKASRRFPSESAR